MCLAEAIESDKDNRGKALRCERPGSRSDRGGVNIGVQDDLDSPIGCANHSTQGAEIGWHREEFSERHLGGQVAASGVDVESRLRHAIYIGDR
jgi:hypothetical protein